MKIISGIVLILLSVYSFYSCFKGKDETAVVFTSDSFFLRKLLGKKYKYFINFVMGVVELVFGIALLADQL